MSRELVIAGRSPLRLFERDLRLDTDVLDAIVFRHRDGELTITASHRTIRDRRGIALAHRWAVALRYGDYEYVALEGIDPYVIAGDLRADLLTGEHPRLFDALIVRRAA